MSLFGIGAISIHAPSRERLKQTLDVWHLSQFQSTLPRGSDPAVVARLEELGLFQSTLPRGSDRIKMKYFYNYINQAFVANKLNLNSKRFHFDVRKYKLSHTSLSCEPKLNLWFIYLRNTKILVYNLPPPL